MSTAQSRQRAPLNSASMAGHPKRFACVEYWLTNPGGCVHLISMPSGRIEHGGE